MTAQKKIFFFLRPGQYDDYFHPALLPETRYFSILALSEDNTRTLYSFFSITSVVTICNKNKEAKTIFRLAILMIAIAAAHQAKRESGRRAADTPLSARSTTCTSFINEFIDT